ncbi:hypothetical protein GCM10027440_53790 [Nocardiopsis coralliicola]
MLRRVATTPMTYAGPAGAGAATTRTGGVPLVPDGFGWPRCTECSVPLQFLAPVLFGGPGPAERALSVVQCQNGPGLYAERDPAAGGNRALVFPTAGLTASPVPAGGTALLPEPSAIDRVPASAPCAEAGPQRTAGRCGTSSASSAELRRGCGATQLRTASRAPRAPRARSPGSAGHRSAPRPAAGPAAGPLQARSTGIHSSASTVESSG